MLSLSECLLMTIASIGLSTQRGTFTTWDRTSGRLLHPLITWQDTRASDICHQVNNSCKVKAIAVLFRFLSAVWDSPRNRFISKIKFHNAVSTLRLRWVLDNMPEARRIAAAGNLCYGTLDTYLVWRLTGKAVYATDFSQFSATGLFDVFKFRVNTFLFDLINIPHNLVLPEVKDTNGDFGATLPELFGASIPIRAVIGDQPSSLFGQGCFDQGDAKITLGTGAFVSVNTGASPGAGRVVGVSSLVAWKLGEHIRFTCESSSGNAGLVLEWGRRAGLYDEPKSTDTIARSVPHSQGTTFAAAFAGLLTAHTDATARGAIMGLATNVTTPHMVRALLEHLAFTTEELYRVAVATTPNLKTPILIDGGVCNNDFIVETISDLIGVPIDRAIEKESSLLGAAYIAGLAVGFWASQEELRRLRQTERAFLPRTASRSTVASHRRWQEGIRRVKNWPFGNDHLAEEEEVPIEEQGDTALLLCVEEK